MKTLLQPGDKIKIRSDIETETEYHMKTNDSYDLYTCLMMDPSSLVTIKDIRHSKYVIEEDTFYSYTDEMFESDIIEYLYEEYLNK